MKAKAFNSIPSLEHCKIVPRALKSLKGFEHLTDEQAQEIIDLLEKLARELPVSKSIASEQKLLSIINSGNYDEVTIEFKDKKIHSLTLLRLEDTNRKITEVLKQNPFQEITIKNHRGRITRLQRKIKIKL